MRKKNSLNPSKSFAKNVRFINCNFGKLAKKDVLKNLVYINNPNVLNNSLLKQFKLNLIFKNTADF